MEYLVVCSVALVAAGLTLVSGFGLGTLLMPAFAIFFPVPASIAATAIVHLASNLFSLGLVARHADRRMVLLFGVPAAAAAFLGAWLLKSLATIAPLTTWSFADHRFEITIVKLVVAVLIFCFALLDLLPILPQFSIGPRLLPVGGMLSGFFGGLSGHQGTLRAAFLMRTGVSKETYVGLNCVCGVMVDVARLLVYGLGIFTATVAGDRPIRVSLVLAACGAAFAGAFIGSRIIRKVTLGTLRWIVGILLLLSAVAMGVGIL
ncbi:MAG: sulfite exporter TauE/SafE family protein [Planctomycetes bacterium]|nr:sulfite exporter TauE/SafE family protein [Planctomycetota bacterium]